MFEVPRVCSTMRNRYSTDADGIIATECSDANFCNARDSFGVNKMRQWFAWCCWIKISMILLFVSAASAVTTPLVYNINPTYGVAIQKVVVAPGASQEVLVAAQDLATYLGRITAANFQVITGNGTSGIAVGEWDDFPSLGFTEYLGGGEISKRERYRLLSHSNGVYVIGATSNAVQDAVWDFLHRLGYRQFFPGQKWEIVPFILNLSVTLDSLEEPDFAVREIVFGFGTWGYNDQAWKDWCKRNRIANQGSVPSALIINTSHAYDQIIADNQAAFNAHPEYLCSSAPDNKFCVANLGLQQLVKDYAIGKFTSTPSLQSISMEPSDGGGWCESGVCTSLGSVSDQVVTLANVVADAVMQQFGNDKYVGIYAYGFHSPVPNIAINPNVIPSVATYFLHGGFTLDELLTGWGAKADMIGIRDYLGVYSWDFDMPGRADAADLSYMQTKIPYFYSKDARVYITEASDNWGCSGLGYYLGSRLLWDISEASQSDAIRQDFLDKAFKDANVPMSAFYNRIDGANNPQLSRDLVGRMYRDLDQALHSTSNTAVKARINDLLLYTRFVDLFRLYQIPSSNPARQNAFEAVIRFGYRMRTTMMIHALAMYRYLDYLDPAVAIPAGCEWDVPEGTNPWKNSDPFTQQELDTILAQGIANNQLSNIEPVNFSRDLTPAEPLNLPSVTTGTFGTYIRGSQVFYTWFNNIADSVQLQITGGLIYGNLGNVKLDLYQVDKTGDIAVDHDEVAPDKTLHTVTLTALNPGLHKIVINDQYDGTTVGWASGIKMTQESSLANPSLLGNRWTLYFYVPVGTASVGGFAETTGWDNAGELWDGSGNKVYQFNSEPNDFSVTVPTGQDGKLWKFYNSGGTRQLMTVPPYFARRANEFVLPREVVLPECGDIGTFYKKADFDKNCNVDFRDLAKFSEHWLDTGCGVGNSWCDGADLNYLGDVNMHDLALLAYDWLMCTDPAIGANCDQY